MTDYTLVILLAWHLFRDASGTEKEECLILNWVVYGEPSNSLSEQLLHLRQEC